MTSKTSTGPRGFTLVELLVVMGIIAILIGVSMGTYGMAIRAAQAAKCVHNMRQIGVGFSGYLGDHNNVLPQRIYGDNVAYFDVLAPYTGNNTTDKADSIFVCPTQTSNDFPTEPSYGMNWYYDNASVLTVPSLTTTIMVAETYGSFGTGSNRADRDSGDPGELDPKRHSGKANYLFFDGHIERMQFSDTYSPPTINMWGTDDGNHSVQIPPP